MSQNINLVRSYEDELEELQDKIVKLLWNPEPTREQQQQLQSLRNELEEMIHENGPGRTQESSFGDQIEAHWEYETGLDAHDEEVAYERDRDFGYWPPEYDRYSDEDVHPYSGYGEDP